LRLGTMLKFLNPISSLLRLDVENSDIKLVVNP